MKKQRTRLLVGATVLVLVFFSGLPLVIAKIGDRIMDDKVYSAEVKTVQFMQELTDLERLHLIDSGMSVEIAEDRTNLKIEDMKEILATALEPYINQGLIVGTIDDFSMVTCDPYRCYSNEFSNLSGNFWEIRLELWDDLGQSLSVCLDDQTGKVLLVSYECLEPIYNPAMLDEYSAILLDSYYASMDNFEFYIDNLEEEYKKVSNSHSVRMYMPDVLYGEIGVRFTASTNGFRIYFD